MREAHTIMAGLGFLLISVMPLQASAAMLAPANFSVTENLDGSVTGSWDGVVDADKYDMQASTDADFSPVFATYTVNAPTISATTDILTPGDWFFRVRGKTVGSHAVTGAWSDSQNAVILEEETEPVDDVPPVLHLPADMVLEATGPDGAVASFVATADDEAPLNPLVSCTPAPGSTFALGVTPVECSATDTAGNTAEGSFTVTVVDTTAPTISPLETTVNVLVGAPSSVLVAPSVSDVVDTDPELTNDAPLAFGAGTTDVTWTATDFSGNISTSTTHVVATYAFSGFLQPIPLPVSTFKAGSTIPVKFRLADYYGNSIANAAVKISTGGPSLGLARYDATAGQYIFNLSTKGMAPGALTITATLDDATVKFVTVTLK
jgi:hypothetical protein